MNLAHTLDSHDHTTFQFNSQNQTGSAYSSPSTSTSNNFSRGSNRSNFFSFSLVQKKTNICFLILLNQPLSKIKLDKFQKYLKTLKYEIPKSC